MWISWRLLRHAQSDCCQLAFLAGRSRRHGKLDVESICKTSLSSISATWFLIITSCANLVPFLVDLGYINRRFFWAAASNDWPCSAAARNLQSRKWWAKWHMAKQNGGGHLVQHPFLWLFYIILYHDLNERLYDLTKIPFKWQSFDAVSFYKAANRVL